MRVNQSEIRGLRKEKTVTERHNLPGPGEYSDPELLQAEAHSGPIPDGEMLGVDPAQERRRTLPHPVAVEPQETIRSADIREHNGARRESAERGASLAHRTRLDVSEQRLDHSASEQGREQALDSVRDDAGPQSDQC